MNQDQRKFLIERVNKTFNQQQKKITDRKPIKPSLNNYLVAAFLDGTIQFNDIAALKHKMRETVLRYGVDDRLIRSKRNDRYRYSSDDTEDSATDVCEVVAKDLFIIPENYLAALAEYETEMEKIKTELETLEAQRDTILLKIQIGSNQVLDKLITQVDNLADLNIMNSQFLLTDGK